MNLNNCTCSVSTKQHPGKEIQFEVKLKHDAFGWTRSLVLVLAEVGKKGKYVFSETALSYSNDHVTIPTPESKSGRRKRAGECPEAKIYFGLYKVWSGKWREGFRSASSTSTHALDEPTITIVLLFMWVSCLITTIIN
ncbi:hypothetical protein K1719_002435 [Acacia pycnantha]|nr:hypothetical protein K1719_002435 [Acacia pycnantha]